MSGLRFTTSYRTAIDVGRISGIPIPSNWEETSTKKLIYLCSQILIAIFIIFKIMCAVYAITHNNKFEDVIFGAATLMFTLTGLFITIFYAVYGGDFITTTENVDSVCNMIAQSELRSQNIFLDLYSSNARILSTATMVMTIATLSSPTFFSFSVPVIGYIQGNYKDKMALPTHCLFERKHHEFYEVFVLLEFLGLVFPALQKLGNEFIMLGLYKTQASCFKYLSISLHGIGQELHTKGITCAQKKLLAWIKLHQSIIRNTHDLITLFSPVVVLYYVSIICIVAGGVFYTLNAKEANVIQAMFLEVYMVITVIHLYVQCQMADELSSEADKLAIAVYSLPWYDMGSINKEYIKLIIKMANREISVVAFRAPAFTLNKVSFVAFMKSTISAYMGFSKIMGIE